MFWLHVHPQMLFGELSDAVPFALHEQLTAEQLLCSLENPTV